MKGWSYVCIVRTKINITIKKKCADLPSILSICFKMDVEGWGEAAEGAAVRGG